MEKRLLASIRARHVFDQQQFASNHEPSYDANLESVEPVAHAAAQDGRRAASSAGESHTGIRHGMSMQEFIEHFDAGRLSVDQSGDFSVAPTVPGPELWANPESDTYWEWVMSVWRHVTGRTEYHPEVDEAFDVPFDHFLRQPWPYHSGSAVEVANYTGAIAWMLRVVEPSPGDRVVEYGSGWGLLALNLAMLGCEVTAIDLNPPSVELLQKRADLWGVPMNVVESTFLGYEASDVDLVIFFEAFHHCDRPFALLDRCTAHLRTGGRVVFLADAIYDSFYCPWGVRHDGHAMYMARYAGWLELGFDREFFYRQLDLRGFEVSDHWAPELGAHGTLVVGTRR